MTQREIEFVRTQLSQGKKVLIRTKGQTVLVVGERTYAFLVNTGPEVWVDPAEAELVGLEGKCSLNPFTLRVPLTKENHVSIAAGRGGQMKALYCSAEGANRWHNWCPGRSKGDSGSWRCTGCGLEQTLAESKASKKPKESQK